MMFKVGSLFSGIGGFDLGLERAGMEVIWQVEIDRNCNQVLTKHWPKCRRYLNVEEVGKHNLAPVDLICGGFPCQDLSVAGRRIGLDGERSGLWFEFARIISELAPEWVLIENVPGLLSSQGGNDFRIILQWLVERGYGVAWRVFNSQYFGLAQRRKRVFIVGSLGTMRCTQVLFESACVCGDSPQGREKGERVARDFEAGTYNARAWQQEDGVSGTLQSKKTGGWSVNYTPLIADANKAVDLRNSTLDDTAMSLQSGGMGEERGRCINAIPHAIDAYAINFEHGLAPHGSMEIKNKVDQITASEFKGKTAIITDARGLGDGEICPSLVGDHMNRVTDYTPVIAFKCGQSAKARSLGISKEVAPTLGDFDGNKPCIAMRESDQNYWAEDEAKPLRDDQIMAFAQNTRDEVRIQGNGKICGALAAEPGMKQTTYVAQLVGDRDNPSFSIYKDKHPSLSANPMSDRVPMVLPIDTRNALRTTDKSEMNRQGLGIGKDGDPAPTLTDVFTPAVACTPWDGQRARIHDERGTAPTLQHGAKASGNITPAIAQKFPTLRGFGHGWQGQHNDDLAKAMLVRRLTPIECERLQGFPDNWASNLSDSARYRALGNAVSVPVAEWIGRRILIYKS